MIDMEIVYILIIMIILWCSIVGYTVYKYMKNGLKFFDALKYSLYKMF